MALFDYEHSARGQFDQPVGGPAEDPVVERRVAFEAGDEEIKTVPLDEGDDGGGRTPDDNMSHELDATMLSLGLRLCHDVSEFAIGDLLFVDDLSCNRTWTQETSSTQIMCARAL